MWPGHGARIKKPHINHASTRCSRSGHFSNCGRIKSNPDSKNAFLRRGSKGTSSTASQREEFGRALLPYNRLRLPSARAGERQIAMYAILPIGDTYSQLFTSLPHNPTRSSIALAKKVQVEPTLAYSQVTKLKKSEELR